MVAAAQHEAPTVVIQSLSAPSSARTHGAGHSAPRRPTHPCIDLLAHTQQWPTVANELGSVREVPNALHLRNNQTIHNGDLESAFEGFVGLEVACDTGHWTVNAPIPCTKHCFGKCSPGRTTSTIVQYSSKWFWRGIGSGSEPEAGSGLVFRLASRMSLTIITSCQYNLTEL